MAEENLEFEEVSDQMNLEGSQFSLSVPIAPRIPSS